MTEFLLQLLKFYQTAELAIYRTNFYYHHNQSAPKLKILQFYSTH